jgi:hypothetical protein
MENRKKLDKYSGVQVNNILATLKRMPKVEKKPSSNLLTKQEIIKILSGEIQAMQRRGYELKDIAQTLNGNGIDISTPTLKSYLQRNKVTKEAKKAVKVYKSIEQPTADSYQTQARPPAASGEKLEDKGSFVIRTDRDDL